ncbi:MAG: cysteine hydrolase [Planctomycetes bacterium]|nr:cysteine hydrolase [Planctomycetota bacterium]
MTLPIPGMVIERHRTALVVTDLQNDFLTPGGAAWGLVAESMAANNTVANIEALLGAARESGYPVFLSPHYYYPSDGKWVAPAGAVEALMGRLGVFARKGPLTLDGFDGSGADWPERFKPLLCACDTVVASPHKVYGTASNDLVLQLRKRRVEKVILAGPVGNLCVEAHLRDFLEHGFEVAAVRDATAGARNEEGDGYRAALVNFRFMAHAVWTTREAVRFMREAADRP